MRSLRERGFAAVELVILLVLAAAIIGVGYVVYSRGQTSGEPSAQQQIDDADTPAAPTINDTSDLDAATKALDDTNLDASTSDSAALDAQTSAF